MKKLLLVTIVGLCLGGLTGCGSTTEPITESGQSVDITEEGQVVVEYDEFKQGDYEDAIDLSKSVFEADQCSFKKSETVDEEIRHTDTIGATFNEPTDLFANIYSEDNVLIAKVQYYGHKPCVITLPGAWGWVTPEALVVDMRKGHVEYYNEYYNDDNILVQEPLDDYAEEAKVNLVESVAHAIAMSK